VVVEKPDWSVVTLFAPVDIASFTEDETPETVLAVFETSEDAVVSASMVSCSFST